MRFKVIIGYYSYGEVIPCKILSASCDDERGQFSSNGVEFGNIRDGVFYPDPIGEWCIDEIPDALQCVRDPRPGEIILHCQPRRSEGYGFERFKKHLGALGEMYFTIGEDGKTVFIEEYTPHQIREPSIVAGFVEY